VEKATNKFFGTAIGSPVSSVVANLVIGKRKNTRFGNLCRPSTFAEKIGRRHLWS